VVATAHVETVMVETDPEGGRSYRLTVTLTDPLRGGLPAEHRANLRVTEGQVGYRTVTGRENRLQTMSFVAFLRWYRDGAGLVRAHWHLSPMTDALVSRVRAATHADDASQGVERVVRQDPAQGSESSE
jgi:hypothetical protein